MRSGRNCAGACGDYTPSGNERRSLARSDLLRRVCSTRQSDHVFCPDDPRISDPRSPLTIDTHCHVFNGTDFGFDFVRPRSRRARIARIDALATLLDSALVIPGTGVRFGLDALIGLVPAVGDIVTTALSLFIVHEAYRLGAPGHILLRMLSNVVVDGALGAVPVVGDAFDVLWRANGRNVRLLREWLEREEWRSADVHDLR